MGEAALAAGYDDTPLFSLDGVTMEVPGRTLLQPLTASFDRQDNRPDRP